MTPVFVPWPTHGNTALIASTHPHRQGAYSMILNSNGRLSRDSMLRTMRPGLLVTGLGSGCPVPLLSPIRAGGRHASRAGTSAGDLSGAYPLKRRFVLRRFARWREDADVHRISQTTASEWTPRVTSLIRSSYLGFWRPGSDDGSQRLLVYLRSISTSYRSSWIATRKSLTSPGSPRVHQQPSRPPRLSVQRP